MSGKEFVREFGVFHEGKCKQCGKQSLYWDFIGGRVSKNFEICPICYDKVCEECLDAHIADHIFRGGNVKSCGGKLYGENVRKKGQR